MTVHDRLSRLEDIQYNIDHYENQILEKIPEIYELLSIHAKQEHKRDIDIKCLAFWKRKFNQELKKLGYNESKYDPDHISDVFIEDIDHKDAPDYCDAFIGRADYYGIKMTDEQLDELNEDSDFVYEKLINQIH